jgi:sugar lactone lactonase YvrE
MSPSGRNIMFTKSFHSPRRFSMYVLTALLFCVSFGKGAAAQGTTPLVTASYAQGLTPPSGLGTVFQTALDSYGDLLAVDYANGGLYEYPVNGGAVVTLVPGGGLGGYANPGIAIDSNNNLYVEANYNNCVLMFPYDTGTKTWDGLATITAASPSTDICPNGGGGTSPYIFAQYGITGVPNGYFQPWALAVDSNNNLVVTAQNNGNFIFLLTVTGSGSTAKAGTATGILEAMSARPQSVAEDRFGNIYFVEETDQKTPLPGVLMIPAGSTGVASDVGLARVDPNLPSVTGVTADASGNLYISDSKEGVFFVPNPSGTPETSSAVLLTPVPADGQVSVDLTRDILYIPTEQSGSQTIAKVTFNAVELGSTATGTPAATSSPVTFSFSGAETPASFAIQEAGTATPDFTIATGGTCVAGTAYAAQSSCTVNVTLSPNAAGDVTAKLLMLAGSNNTLASLTLQGIGTGSALQVQPGTESLIGAGLKTPSQIAVDANDNVYVADSGLGAVEEYPKGYGAIAATATAGANLVAPTGVAVDGAGDVFIADNGNVYEVPIGAAGLNAAGQLTLKGGLGSDLKLAADGFDDLYISDPSNHRVVKLGNIAGTFGPLTQTETDLGGFNAPSSIAVDENGNLYVADGSNLYEVTPTGTQSTLLTTLSNATGLAVDPSGAVYVAMPGGTVRIPSLGGTLTPASQTIIAPTVTSPASVAIDSKEDVYVADSVVEDVNFVSADASINFGTLSSATATATANFSLVNDGNAPFNFTGFTNTADYSVTTTSCVGPEAVGATCGGTITFNPGPGDQGALSTEILAQTGAANSPVGINVVGVGVTLANSTTTVSVTNATVDGAPAVINVAATAGTGAAPTGQVTLTITGPNLTTSVVVTGTLANGTITLTPPQLAAGSYTFSVSYQGDRTYGTSTATAQVTIAAGVVTLTQGPLTPSQSLVEIGGVFYVLAGFTGSQEPYDGSVSQYEYTYPVTIAATDGKALIGQQVIANGKVAGVNYGTVTYQGAPAAGCPPIPVSSNGIGSFSASCFTIDTSNNSIPDLETTYTITPVYSPVGTGSTLCDPTCVTNPNYTAVTGTPITLTALRNPVVQITSSPGSLSVSPGSTVTSTLTLTSVLGYGVAGAGALLNNYSLPVQLACDGLPAYATCSFSYPTPDPSDAQSVDVGPAAGTVLSFMGGTTGPCAAAAPGAVGGCFGPGTVIMTINTNIPSGVASDAHGQSNVIFAAMFGFGLLGFAFSRKKKSLRGSLPTLVCLLLCSGIMAGISGCSTKQLGTTTGNSTPAGTYTVTITAKQVGSQIITQNPGITYGNSNQVSLPFTMNVTIQ